MENEKYFTPDIEDIRVGYVGQYRVGKNYEWYDFEIFDLSTDRYGYGVHEFEEYLKEGNLRVPYLNKEQIIAKGWNSNDDKLLTLDNKQLYSFSNNNFGLLFQPYNNDIQIYDKRREIYVYQGECKCINTFRYLNKLLNI